jgi:acylphosphatase
VSNAHRQAAASIHHSSFIILPSFPMIGRRIFYEGRVQGVGFRYTVRSIAKGFDVVGWVRNLDDGRVELQASGEPDEVRAFLEAIRESDLHSYIKKMEEHEIPPLANVRGFEIAP